MEKVYSIRWLTWSNKNKACKPFRIGEKSSFCRNHDAIVIIFKFLAIINQAYVEITIIMVKYGHNINPWHIKYKNNHRYLYKF